MLEELQGNVAAIHTLWHTQSSISERIEKGINNLLDIKMHLSTAVAFKEQIEDELRRNRKSELYYFIAFIVTLITIPFLVYISYIIEDAINMAWHEAIVLRITFIIPILWIARLFSKNYSQAKLSALKFDHLNRLLGTGASAIVRLVESDNEAKADVHKRIAELFLDIKDIAGVASTEPKHPISEIKELIEAAKNIGSIGKT